MGYYASNCVIEGIHFDVDEWIESNPSFFYTTTEVPKVTPPSCDHPQRVRYAYCPICGKKVENGGTKVRSKEHWHREPCDELCIFETSVSDLYLKQWTDCDTQFYGIGRVLVPSEDASINRAATVDSLDGDTRAFVRSQILQHGLFTEEFVDEHFGIWFIHGGS